MKLKPHEAYAVIDEQLGWTIPPFWHREQAEHWINKQGVNYKIVDVLITPKKRSN
jgi:hypothetical protein